MQVKEFRFLTTKDKSNQIREAWSRAYEYEWILNKLNDKQPLSIHNTGCWGWDIHIAFAYELEKQFWSCVINSDSWGWEMLNYPSNYREYNLLKKGNMLYDSVLCISTLEHLPKDEILKAFQNLLDQTLNDLYITFDYPEVNLEQFENYLWVKCIREWEILNPENSVVPHPERKWLNIVLLHISK